MRIKLVLHRDLLPSCLASALVRGFNLLLRYLELVLQFVAGFVGFLELGAQTFELGLVQFLLEFLYICQYGG
jgi:hypothetical protein